MIEIGDLANLYNGAVNCQNTNGYIFNTEREHADGLPYGYGSRSSHIFHINSLQSGKREGETIHGFSQYRALQHIHVNGGGTYAGQKLYKCNLCDFTALRSDHIKRHKVVHKPYKCDVCEYSTTRSDYHRTHKLIHSGDKPYKCDACDYRTTTSGHLNRHRRIHTGEKPLNVIYVIIVQHSLGN